MPASSAVELDAERTPGSRESPPSFASVLARHGHWPLRRERVRTLQVNVGKLCNQACHHCHVEAGPKRTEVMRRPTVDRLLELLARSPAIEAVDVTGGAPELNPSFRHLVASARSLGRHVIDRCNLTVLLEPGMEWVAEFLREHQVEVVCSLPCYTEDNVDRQRGRGVFEKSIEALCRLNDLGYGLPGSDLRLDLVYNPLGAFLPPPQERLEADYRRELGRRFGIRFHRLLTITNMPIKRFAEQLARSGQHAEYMGLLVNHFNPGTVAALMCRSLLSVGWDGALYDCDFNQMLELRAGREGFGTPPPSIWSLAAFERLASAEIATGPHCFGCTAGAGSSCGGALASPLQP
jgi:radical SAM/Cys-rich protein